LKSIQGSKLCKILGDDFRKQWKSGDYLQPEVIAPIPFNVLGSLIKTYLPRAKNQLVLSLFVNNMEVLLATAHDGIPSVTLVLSGDLSESEAIVECMFFMLCNSSNLPLQLFELKFATEL